MKRKIVTILCSLTCMLTLLSGCGTMEDINGLNQDSTQSQENADDNVADDNNSTDSAAENDGTVAVDKRAKQIYFPELPTGSEEADVFVAPVDGIDDDFIRGADISTLLVEEASDVTYKNEKGEEEDLLKLLADAGVNYVRVRVWNDPYDEEGNGYGGGNCTAETAAEIGRRAAEYGMKLLVDFHYSDFWADPNKQFCPKAWRGTEPDEKAQLLYDYTKESLQTIIDAGADVAMVQIGNEINRGIASETSTKDVMLLLQAGSKAVREVSAETGYDMDIVVHYATLDDTKEATLDRVRTLEEYQIDYDIFGESYYPFWHNTMEEMEETMAEAKELSGKKVCIMETSYPYTAEDGDASGNSAGEDLEMEEYPYSVQGQASCIRDVVAHAVKAGCIGVFYWEPAWCPVTDSMDHDINSQIWEEYGSGWASSYAGSYDKMDAGKYYGGSSWDNQAMFDFSGQKLASLDVWKYLKYGATSDLKVMYLQTENVQLPLGGEVQLPDTVSAVYNDPSVKKEIAVEWDKEDVAQISTKEVGSYTVKGTTEDGEEVSIEVAVISANYVENPSFEEDNTAIWKSTDTTSTDIQDKAGDAHTGTKAFHFWSNSAMDFEVTQELQDVTSGIFSAEAAFQGGDVGDQAQIYLFVEVNGQRIQSDPVELTGWAQWQIPEITNIEVQEGDTVVIGAHVTSAAKGWGTIDDFNFYSPR